METRTSAEETIHFNKSVNLGQINKGFGSIVLVSSIK